MASIDCCTKLRLRKCLYTSEICTIYNQVHTEIIFFLTGSSTVLKTVNQFWLSHNVWFMSTPASKMAVVRILKKYMNHTKCTAFPKIKVNVKLEMFINFKKF